MHKRVTPLLVAGLVALAACGDTESGGTEPTGPTTRTDETDVTDVTHVTDDDASTNDRSPRRLDHLDPHDYLDDYRSPVEDVERSTAAAPTGGALNALPTADLVDGFPPLPEPPGPLDDNVFVDSGDSLWTAARDDAESTFGLDIDTGSFSVAQAFLDQGFLPEPDSIRVEEWINAVNRADPAPQDGADLAAAIETHPAPRAGEGAGTHLVRIGISTRELTDDERPAANITFVVDTSGSMDIRERLGLVKASLGLLVQHLRDDDTIAIVTYGDEARPLLEPTAVRDTAPILAAIDGLQPGGSTNLEAGLRTGYEQARSTQDDDSLNVVVLASDGVANVGVTDATVLTDEITQAGEDGIHLVTVGFGMGNYNDYLMEGLADMGDGFYSYVDAFAEAERLFVDELTPTLTVVAGDAKAQVVFDADTVSDYRLIGYENRMLDDEDFTDDTVDAGEIGAGHHVTVLYEVRLADASEPPLPPRDASAEPVNVGELRLRWRSTSSGATEELRMPIASSSGGQSTDRFRLAALVADLAELLKGNGVVAGRDITFDALAAEASALAADGVEPAVELVTMIDQAGALDD